MNDALLSDILDTAIDVMASDAASVQMLAADGQSLNLLAWKHFDPVSAQFWQKVTVTGACSCGKALSKNERVLVTDVEACEFMIGTQDLVEYQRSRIRAVQSTPLLSRSGRPLGMLSTHWNAAYTADAARFRLFDVLARQTADFLERAVAEDTLSSVSHQLIEAQEAERRRLAHELQDGISARLLILSLRLTEVKRTGASAPETMEKLDELRTQVEQIGEDVRAISYRLHPPRLEFVRPATAAESLCREMSRAHGVEIGFHADNVPDTLSARIRVCLYRVLQEALQNAIRHSGAASVEVSMHGGNDQIELTIEDSGIGFDLAATHRRGLGLPSMKERLKAVDGSLMVWSYPQRGTSVLARVPLRQD